MEETMAMNKEQLKQKLLAAHVPEAAVDERLSKITEEQLKELKLDEIPDAVLLKEFELEPETEGEQPDAPDTTKKDADQGDEASFVLDKSVLESRATTVKETVTTVVKELMSNLEIEIPEFKELNDLIALKADVTEIKKMLTATTAQQVQQVMKDSTRSGKLRILHFKQTPAADEENLADQGADEEEEGKVPGKKKPAKKELDGVVIEGADGEHADNMTDFMMGKPK
jgi:preprotein translocase subunit SecD